jgi:hypothetical protein
LTPLLKEAFPQTKPVSRPLEKNSEIKDPEWLSGFVSGDGSFLVKLRKLSSFKVGFQVVLVLQITQNERDEELMETLRSYFGNGGIDRVSSTSSALNFKISSFSSSATFVTFVTKFYLWKNYSIFSPTSNHRGKIRGFLWLS